MQAKLIWRLRNAGVSAIATNLYELFLLLLSSSAQQHGLSLISAEGSAAAQTMVILDQWSVSSHLGQQLDLQQHLRDNA